MLDFSSILFLEVSMRRPEMDLEQVKQKILALKGKNVSMEVNKGRKKFVQYQGTISDIYRSVFVIKIQNDDLVDKLSYSFSDVLCGMVKIKLKE